MSDLSGTSTKSYSQRNNIDALLHDRVKEPQISALDFPSEDQMYQMDGKTQYSNLPYSKISLEDDRQTQRNEVQQNNVQTYSQDSQPQFDTEQGLAVNTNYEQPQNEPHKTAVFPNLDVVHRYTTDTAPTAAKVETTTRRKIEGLSEIDDESLDDPLGNRIESSVLKSLLG